MPVPLPPPPPAEVRPVAANDLRADNQRAAELQGKTVDLKQQEILIPVGGAAGENLRLQADTQQYTFEEERFVARGNVRMDFRESYLLADELQVDLKTRIAIAVGNIRLVRGAQEVTGERIEYNFALEEGALYQAKGILNTQTLTQLEAPSPLANDPAPPPAGGQVLPRTQRGRVVRFQAERIRFSPKGWEGEGVRVTNDPFDPPELEVVTQKAYLTRKPDGTEQLDTESSALVFDQVNSIPLPTFGLKFGGDEEDTLPLQLGYDAQDKGGFFYQQNFNFTQADGSLIRVEPRFFLQQAIGLRDRGNNEGFSFGDLASQAQTPDQGNVGESFGLGVRYRSAPSPQQQTNLFAEINGLSFDEFTRRVRLRAEQRYLLEGGSLLSFSYIYRERVFNGIFGTQPVSQRIEAALDSAVIPLDTTTDLTYTTGLALVQAPSDRTNLPLAEGASGSLEATLGRFQAAAAVTRRFPLYEAETTPATREFLQYTPNPVTPNFSLLIGATGVGSVYSSADAQGTLTGTVRVGGVLGRFAREALDYTQVGVSYSQSLIEGRSPFIFDRAATTQRLTADFLQQVYGPIRAGIQTSWDVSTGREIDRWYVLRYDRRTYGIGLSFSPIQRTGTFEFRIDDFNWGVDEAGRPSLPTPVSDGLVRRSNR